MVSRGDKEGSGATNSKTERGVYRKEKSDFHLGNFLF